MTVLVPTLTSRVIQTMLSMFLLGLSHAQAADRTCDPIATFADGNVPSREIFVSPTGSDSEGDGSRDRPFRGLARAARDVRPGTALRLLPGNYGGGHFIENLAGTAEAPIWIGGIPGQPRPVLSGSSEGIHLTRVRYLVIENLEVTGATGNGINVDDGGAYADSEATRFIVFRNLFIHDIGTGGNQDCLKLSGLDDFWVLDCEFARGSAGGSGIDHVGCHRGWIVQCRFESMGSNSIQAKGGSEDIEIRECRFINGGQRAINLGGSTGFQFFRPPLSTTSPNAEARNLRVLSNVFQGSDAPVAFVGCVDSLVANNTIIDPARWVARILQETVSGGGYTFLPSGGSRFINNLVSFRRSQLSTFINVGGNTDPASFTFANNLWHARDNPAQSRPSLPLPETNGIVGRDPQLADPTAGEVRIPADSPAAGAGQPLPEVTSDLRQRCLATPPTIGAWEPNPAKPKDTDADGLPDRWEERQGLNPSDPTDAALDRDGDGHDNLEEFLAGTDLADPQSLFRITALEPHSAGVRLVFSTVADLHYTVERGAHAAGPSWTALETLPGTGASREFFASLTSEPSVIFRVRSEPSSSGAVATPLDSR